tara:strand:+ start:18604 stop:19857 length:1254 start_codon:yes stop_codon:yes gene_type:complete
MHEESADLSITQHESYAWRDVLAKLALLIFGIALWHKGFSFYIYIAAHYLLLLACFFDVNLNKIREIMKEPFVAGILILCTVMALGIIWSDDPNRGFRTLRRYSAFLFFIPYLALLNKKRLPWAIGGLLVGYFGVLATGIYQWLILEKQGIPALDIPYLHFSSMLGIGLLLTVYFTSTIHNFKIKLCLAPFSILLLFIQFNQNARGILIATIISCVLLIFLIFKKKLRKFLIIITFFALLCGIFAVNNTNLQERIAQAKDDIALTKSGDYNTSLGLRFAWWDVGLQGISEKPLFGHGTGMVLHYFDKYVETYKEGLYKNLPRLDHYHNDWIEIGMHIGMLGLLAYTYFLWGWFQILKTNQLGTLGAALVCFIFLCGITDLLVFFRQIIYLLLCITAIGIYWHRTYGINSVPITIKEN